MRLAKDGRPLIRCPHCDWDLTRSDGLRLTCGCPGEEYSFVEDDGEVFDVDWLTRDGHRADVLCGWHPCRRSLAEFKEKG